MNDLKTREILKFVLLIITFTVIVILVISCNNTLLPSDTSEPTHTDSDISSENPTLTPTSKPTPHQSPEPTPVQTISPTPTPVQTISPTPTQRAILEINGLVPLLDFDGKFMIDLKYATSDNFTGKKIYPVAIAVIHKETAARLIKANNRFLEDGYKIKVWDAYRPIHVQQIFWDVYPDPKFVARPPSPTDPNPRPSHCNGMSVDITLVDLNGKELEMPSEFDDFSDRASAGFPDMSQEARKNVDYLIGIMEEYGFENYSGEWWHFDDIKSTPVSYQDIPLESFVK